MTGWAKGFWIGALLVGILVAVVGTTRVEGFVRITPADQLVLDVRGDESALSRVVNLPVGTLGETALVKRSYVLVQTYDFTLRLRREVVEAEIRGLTVTVHLPGTVTATNATEVTGGIARWATVPPTGLELRTRAIQWIPIMVVLVAIVGTVVFSKDLPRTRQNHRVR
jgi:hypothetical protein